MYDDQEESSPRSFREIVARVVENMNPWRPISYYLMFAIFAVLILATQLYFVRDNPGRYAFILSLLFIFAFAVAVRALYDVTDLIRRGMRERRELHRATLGDESFMRELGRRVAEKRDRE
ncbi:MAG: hypothetical protein AMXMBFR84_24130 [Candidatus Hydrogenedentota bacterium]